MFGSHLSIAGGMVNALLQAKTLRMDCVQVYTRNQRQWAAPPLRDENCDAWLRQLEVMKWSTAADQPRRVISHNSYLINMASPDAALWKKSLDAQRDELERCEALDIPFLVSHPGAHLGERPLNNDRLSKDERAGLQRIVKALDRIHRDLPGHRTITCLETTAGAGTNLGWRFEHLRFVRDHVKAPERIGFCFDTCHVTAAGYDMRTAEAASAVLEEWDQVCGFEHLLVFHVNDSVGDVGSRRDRHAHIGEGCCGRECFRSILNHPRLAGVPKILETPKEEDPKGVPYDLINIRRLKRLKRVIRGSSGDR